MRRGRKQIDFTWFPPFACSHKRGHSMKHVETPFYQEMGRNGEPKLVRMENIWECMRCGIRANIKLK